MSRVDDMFNIRGVNVYPTGIEGVVRGFADVVEFRTTVTEEQQMKALSVELEVTSHADPVAIIDKVAIRLKDSLGCACAWSRLVRCRASR